MIVDFAVACDYALVDQHGKLSVLGIFQHIWVARFPTVHPRLHLVLRLKGKSAEVGDHTIDILLLDEQNTEILRGNGSVTFAEPPIGATEIEAGAVLSFDIPLQQAGRYRFEVLVNGELAATVPLGVSLAQGQHSPIPGPGPAPVTGHMH